MNMYRYVYIYIYTHIFIYTHIHTYIHTYISGSLQIFPALGSQGIIRCRGVADRYAIIQYTLIQHVYIHIYTCMYICTILSYTILYYTILYYTQGMHVKCGMLQRWSKTPMKDRRACEDDCMFVCQRSLSRPEFITILNVVYIM